MFDGLLEESRDAFNQSRTFEKARSLAYGAITCMGRHTLTGMLTACGKQFTDWSASYRIFGKDRLDVDKVFDVSIRHSLEYSPKNMLVAHIDDTLLRKSGKKVAGTAWRRDPLGPPFHTNFIWAQRFVQMGISVPQEQGPCQARCIPVDFVHCPSIKKPRRTASAEEWATYRQATRAFNMSKQGSLCIQKLRTKVDALGHQGKEIVVSVDGGYTNRTVLKSLPKGVTLIGRVRKDAKFYLPASQQPQFGRRKVYGDRVPTPEEIRKSEKIPWRQVKAWAAGKEHTFDIKVVPHLMWRASGEKHKLTLIVMRPLAYRRSKQAKILYRDPAYLIHTECNLSIQDMVQAYLWRWGMEVNFRDEKTIIGTGQAQVRTKNAVKNVPAFVTAMYSFLNLAAHEAHRKRTVQILPRPKWYPASKDQRITVTEMLSHFRFLFWTRQNKSHFSGFVQKEHNHHKLKKITNPFDAVVFYQRK